MKKIISIILALLACVALALISACKENEDVFDENEYGEFTVNYTVYVENEQNIRMKKLTQSKEVFDKYVQGEDEGSNIVMCVLLNLTESNDYNDKLSKFAELYGIDLNSENYITSMYSHLSSITLIFDDYECYREYGDPIIGRLESCNMYGCLTVSTMGPLINGIVA